ncbi:MAG TPA: class II aldolase/adducin family protein, partial [Caulobacteraceae bacterium]
MLRRMMGRVGLAAVLACALAGAGYAAGDPDEDNVSMLVIANHVLADQGVLDGFGHITVRSTKTPDHYFMAVSRAPAIITRADIIEFDDKDGSPVRPEKRDLYSERFIHGEIYRVRPDVKSVVHAHTQAVLPFGLTKTPFRPVVHVAYFLGFDPVPVFDIRDVAGEDNKMLVNTAPLGAGLAKTLGQRSVVLMRGHGMTVVGGSIQEAVFRAVYTKFNAEVELETLRLGPPNFLNKYEVNRSERIVRQWEAWVDEAAAKQRAAPA